MRRREFALAACGVVLLLGLKAPAQQGGERVAGRVVSTRDDHPLANAKVTLRSSKTQEIVATAMTDGEGRFRFETVPPGKYRMTGVAANYQGAAYMEHEGYATAIVTGAGLATGSLELRLTPWATISGRVFDGLEPVQNATVTVYREEPGSKGKATQVNSVQTDDGGAFEISHLAAARYFLAVRGTPWYAVHPPVEPENAQMPYRSAVDAALDMAYPRVFYPDALRPADALPIEIRGGEQIKANLQMHPMHAVTLTVRPAAGEKTNRPWEMLSQTVFGIEEMVPAQMAQVDGVRQYSGLPPGEYALRVMTQNGMPSSSQTVDVRGGLSAVDEQAPAETASLSVAAHAADGESLGEQLVVGLRSMENHNTSGMRFNDKGVAEFSGVPAGTYRMAFTGGGRTQHVAAMRVDGKVVEDGKVVVAGTAPVAVDVTLTSAQLSVEGVAHREGKPAAGVFVVLVPAGSDAEDHLFRRDQSDLDGSFTFSDVAPGSYIVIASGDVEALHWSDAETLVPYLLQGVPVSVPATDGAVVHLSGPVSVRAR